MEWWIELFLIVLGGGLQVWGIRETARELIMASDAADGGLDAPSLLRWFVGVPRRGRTVSLLGSGRMEATGRAPSVVVGRTKPPVGEYDEWIEFLDRRVEELGRDIKDLVTKACAFHDKQIADMKALRSIVEKLRLELREEMRQATVSNARISLSGILYIVGGIVVSAVAAPIARCIAAVVSGLG